MGLLDLLRKPQPAPVVRQEGGATWYWNAAAKRYYDAATGQFMARETVLGYVEQSIAASGNAVDQLAHLVSEGALSPADWRDAMRQEVKEEYIRQYMLGRGGRPQMTDADWGSVGGQLKNQYSYLDKFTDQVATGELSEAQIRARARMYTDSAGQAFERGQARAYGLPQLPAYPRDGTTKCLSNCRCEWLIEEVYDERGHFLGWNCYWRLNPAEHCDDCLANAGRWNPLFVEAT